jgi:hypothetical protein
MHNLSEFMKTLLNRCCPRSIQDPRQKVMEDGSVESRHRWQVHARLGYRREGWEIALDGFNLLGRDDHDMEYFYASRLPGEPLEGVEDIHLHPAEPRTIRVSLTRHF